MAVLPLRRHVDVESEPQLEQTGDGDPGVLYCMFEQIEKFGSRTNRTSSIFNGFF